MLFNKKSYLNLQLTWRLTMRAGESIAYRESPGQTGRLNRSVHIEASLLNLSIFFFTFLQHEKAYSHRHNKSFTSKPN